MPFDCSNTPVLSVVVAVVLVAVALGAEAVAVTAAVVVVLDPVSNFLCFAESIHHVSMWQQIKKVFNHSKELHLLGFG